jgi:toxin HigB-1
VIWLFPPVYGNPLGVTRSESVHKTHRSPYNVIQHITGVQMIWSFLHRGLERFFARSDHRGIPPDRASRIKRQLDRLDTAVRSEDMNLPGWRWHPLKGDRKGTYAVRVSGNLRITYRWDGEDAVDLNLEDYH